MSANRPPGPATKLDFCIAPRNLRRGGDRDECGVRKPVVANIINEHVRTRKIRSILLRQYCQRGDAKRRASISDFCGQTNIDGRAIITLVAESKTVRLTVGYRPADGNQEDSTSTKAENVFNSIYTGPITPVSEQWSVIASTTSRVLLASEATIPHAGDDRSYRWACAHRFLTSCYIIVSANTMIVFVSRGPCVLDGLVSRSAMQRNATPFSKILKCCSIISATVGSSG